MKPTETQQDVETLTEVMDAEQEQEFRELAEALVLASRKTKSKRSGKKPIKDWEKDLAAEVNLSPREE